MLRVSLILIKFTNERMRTAPSPHRQRAHTTLIAAFYPAGSAYDGSTSVPTGSAILDMPERE